MLVSPINFHHLREAELLQDRLREQRLVHQHVVQQSDREYHNRQRVCVIDEVVINNFNQLVLYERIVVSVLVEVDSHIADKLQEYYVRSVFLSPGDDLIEALLQEYSNYLAVVTIEYGHNEMQPHILQLA